RIVFLSSLIPHPSSLPRNRGTSEMKRRLCAVVVAGTRREGRRTKDEGRIRRSSFVLITSSLLVMALGGWLLNLPAAGQGRVKKVQPPVVVQPGPLPPQQVPPGDVKKDEDSGQYSAIQLIENSDYRKYVEVAKECIKDKTWNDLVDALKPILDSKEDFYV